MSSKLINDEYVFTSERLGYRTIKENDFDDWFTLDGNSEVRSFFPSGVLDQQSVKDKIKKNIEFFNDNGFGQFTTIELDAGEFVGRCGFGMLPTGEIEVGYVFLPKFWGKGLASEALIALIEWAKLNIHSVNSIVALTPTNHAASERVMQKVGMQYYKNGFKDGQECVFYKVTLRGPDLK